MSYISLISLVACTLHVLFPQDTLPPLKVVAAPPKTITLVNPAPHDVYLIFRSSTNRRAETSEVKVPANGNLPVNYTEQMYDVWFARDKTSPAFQVGANIDFDKEAKLEVPLSVSYAATTPDPVTGQFTTHVHSVNGYNYREKQSLTNSNWNSYFVAHDGKSIPATISLSGHAGTFSTAGGQGVLTKVKYLNLPNGKTEISGNWAMAGFHGVFVFNADKDSFNGHSSQNGQKWGVWNGDRKK